MNYYERHIGDYLKDTAHLTLLEHGVYTRLLDVYYTREDGIPEADAGRLVGACLPAEKQALRSVLSEFRAARRAVAPAACGCRNRASAGQAREGVRIRARALGAR